MDLHPGAVIAGRWRALRKVGAGGMGEVWAGEHCETGARVALKTLLPAAKLNHEIVARFKREAYILDRVRSEHVARVVDFITDDTHGLVLVLEFIDGESLARLLTERPLSVEEAVDLGVDLCRGLCDLHQARVVHRDLKPGNVMLERRPASTAGRRRAVLVDFGVSRMNAHDDEEETITGITRVDMAVGTIEYMAPEQVLSSRDVTDVADIYAMGAILYRAAAGRHIHDAETDPELARKKLTTDPPPLPLGRVDELSAAFRSVVMRAVSRRPADRWQSAEEMLAALLPLRTGAPETGDPDEPTAVDRELPEELAAAARAAFGSDGAKGAMPVVERVEAAQPVVRARSLPRAPAKREAGGERTEQTERTERTERERSTPSAARRPVVAPDKVIATPADARAKPSPPKSRVPLGVLIGTLLGILVGATIARMTAPSAGTSSAPATDRAPR